MKKFLITAMLALFATCSFADGLKPIGYPGSNWGELTINPSVIRGTPEDNNILFQGNIEQGIVWMRFGDDNKWKLNTFVGMNYSIDRNGLSYNNKLAPMIGVKMSRDFKDGVLDLGVRFIHENHFRGTFDGPRSGNGVQLFASYWFGWGRGE